MCRLKPVPFQKHRGLTVDRLYGRFLTSVAGRQFGFAGRGQSEVLFISGRGDESFRSFAGQISMTPYSWSPEESSALCDGRVRRKSFKGGFRAKVSFVAVSFLMVGCFVASPAEGFTQQAASQPQSASSSSATALDAPSPVQPKPKRADDEERLPQTKRILGIIPNFRAVSTDETLPRQTVKDKFMDATSDSFDYSSILLPAALAGFSMATDAYPEFHQGAAGYARYFWHAAVDQTSENYMVEFVGPVLTREDSRYYTLGRGGFAKRTGYAISRAFITRTDSASETFNFSEIVGAGAAAGLSSLYYPTRERSLGNTGSQWGLDVGIDAASFVVREFWPDINKHLFHQKISADSVAR